MPRLDAHRWILHADMDAFFASVEQRDFPELRGLPVVVGGPSRRGVVAAASYEARRYGIRSAMPMRDALRRCPDLVVQRSRMSVYQEVSRTVFDVFGSITPSVQGLSLDEAFLDISASIALFGEPLHIGRRLKRSVHDATGLTVSVGIAPNKLVAKIASDLDKPDGLTIVAADAIRATLDPLPIQVIPGIGRRTLARLQGQGLSRVADLRAAPASVLESVFGKMAEAMRQRAAGIDERPVVTETEDKSISAEETFADDIGELGELDRELLRLSERTATRVRSRGLLARTVQIKIRRADFRTFTRQAALAPASNRTDAIYRSARTLLHRWWHENPGVRIRLIGVGCSGFARADQIDLFDGGTQPSGGALDRTVDSIRERFGGRALTRGRTMPRGGGRTDGNV